MQVIKIRETVILYCLATGKVERDKDSSNMNKMNSSLSGKRALVIEDNDVNVM
jgi:hypothetical protein